MDYWFRLYLLVGAIHYVFDSIIKLYYYGGECFRPGCASRYFLHHAATFVQFQSLWMVDYYPWFIALPPSYHCLLVAYPTLEYNNYIYAASLVPYVLCQLCEPTFWNSRVHKSILMRCPFVMIPIFLMSIEPCTEQWDIKWMRE